MSDFDFTDISRLIKIKEAEIAKRTNTGLHDNLNFKKLISIFNTYKNKRPLSGSISILIKQEEVENLIEDCSDLIFDVVDLCIEKTHNHVVISRNCELQSSTTNHYNSSNDARRVFLEFSQEFCVFIVKPTEVHYFLNGDDVGKVIFFEKEEEERFIRLKDISQINELFDDYRIKLAVRDTYRKFFVSKSGKAALYYLLLHKGIIINPTGQDVAKLQKAFMEENQHLLENKPEDRFREDLRIFLNENFKGTVETKKEHLLESFKRIDILITDEYGDLYLIEVKWVGTSIHANGNSIGTSYSDADINPGAITQTLNYLVELHKHKKHIKTGYLTVFDARSLNFPDTVEVFDTSSLTPEQNRFYSRFKKVKDFRVLNTHPN